MSLLDLFRPKWKHSDWLVRSATVERLTDQAVLAQIAENDEDNYVRRAAVERLTDQAVLAEVARTDEDKDVREAAITKLEDQALLAEVARTDKGWSVRVAAMGKLTSQTVLAEIATTNSMWSVRRETVERLTDQAVLAQIATTDGDYVVRRAAVEKLTDEAMIGEIARTDSDKYVRKAAVRKLKDQAVLAEIARADSKRAVRKAAVKALRGEASELLVKIALEDADKGVRDVAAWRLRARAFSVLYRLAGEPLPKWVAKDLGSLSEPMKRIPALAPISRREKERLREGYGYETLVKSLANARDSRAVVPLIHALGTTRGITLVLDKLEAQWARRSEARESVAWLRGYLQHALRHGSWDQGEAIVQALWAIGDPSGVEDIIRVGLGGGCGEKKCSPEHMCSSCRYVAELALEYLTEARNHVVIPLLIRHLSRSRVLSLSCQAAEALGEPIFVKWIVKRAREQGALSPTETPKIAEMAASSDSETAFSRLEERIRTGRGRLAEADVRSVLSLRGKTEYRVWEKGDDYLDPGEGHVPLDLSAVKLAVVERLRAAGFDEGPPLPRLLTAETVAEQTGLSLARVYELARRRDMPAIRLGWALRFDAAAVADWLAAGDTAAHDPGA